PPTLHRRPRATPYRCFVRLRDRLELVLERFVDGDPTAQAGFARYKADRDRRWAERDAKKKKKKKKNKVPAAAVAVSIINGPTDETPVGNAASPEPDEVSSQNHVGEDVGLDVPKTRENDKGKGKKEALRPGDGDDDTGRPAGGSTSKRQTSAPAPRGTPRSATFSSLVGFALEVQRWRKRKRSDARPGYFDPDPFPLGAGRRADATVADVGAGDGDDLEMNVPVELGKRSWTVLIGTAR
ncbi:hypothetical protein LZ30DRAFT_564960, partial [Colletotrichum cereale]